MCPLQLINVLGGAYVTVGRKRDHSTEETSVTMMTVSGMRTKQEGELYKAGSAELPPFPSVAVRPQPFTELFATEPASQPGLAHSWKIANKYF